MLSIECSSLIRRRCCIAHSDVVLNEPFVDGLGGMRHEDAAFKVGLAEDIGKGGRVVNVETKG